VMLSENHPLDVLDHAADFRRESFLHRATYPSSLSFRGRSYEYQGCSENNVGGP
jgi:hypothetical protein